jgi:hypothetical protein
VGLTIEFRGAGDDLQLAIAVRRGELAFATVVWCGEEALEQQRTALQHFLATALARPEPGKPPDPTALTVHFGGAPDMARNCILTVTMKPFGHARVRANLAADYLEEGRDVFELYRCTLHFETDVASLDRFAAALVPRGDNLAELPALHY